MRSQNNQREKVEYSIKYRIQEHIQLCCQVVVSTAPLCKMATISSLFLVLTEKHSQQLSGTASAQNV